MLIKKNVYNSDLTKILIVSKPLCDRTCGHRRFAESVLLGPSLLLYLAPALARDPNPVSLLCNPRPTEGRFLSQKAELQAPERSGWKRPPHSPV